MLFIPDASIFEKYERQQKMLEINRKDLIQLIDLDTDLIYLLYSKGCITGLEKRYIQDLPTGPQRNNKFLDILSFKSPAHFDVFMDCLQGASQGHLQCFLLDQNAGKISFHCDAYFCLLQAQL